MAAKDLQKKSEADLMKRLKDAREELRAFRFGDAGSHTRNVRKGHNLKKEVAQILTELNSRVTK